MPEILGTFSGFEVADLGTLSAAGASSAVQTGGVSLCFQVTVASIGTNVVVRLEGSLDDTSYFDLNSGGDITITSNGTTGYFLVAPVKFVRFRVVSISGGTPSVACKVGAA